jgi:lipopolysaccharide/colanic/teichoic acid biosynthesis glycosyltransferase
MLEYWDGSVDRMQIGSSCIALHATPYRATVLLTPCQPAWSLPDRRGAVVKRVVDIILASLVLSVLALPMLAIVVAIRLGSQGPALFRQRRVGMHGREFEMLKFRTMRHRTGGDGDCRQASRHDPRVTRVGYWLRCLSIDELPQLINVLRGEMSVVGPRPHFPGTRAGGCLFEEVTPQYAERHRVRPGITGLAQVRGWRGETDTEDKLLRRLDSDLEYISTWSLALDLRIILCTMGTVVRMCNAY